jgi:hypothetical protein
MSDRLRGLAIGGCDRDQPVLILVAIPTRRTRDLEPQLPEDGRPGLAPLDDEVDHARGPTAGRLILEYGDNECPYSRQAFRAIEYAHDRPTRLAAGGCDPLLRSAPST